MTERPEDQPAEPIPGQLDVYDCLEIAKSDGFGNQDRQDHKGKAKPLTAAQVVALRLKGTV